MKIDSSGIYNTVTEIVSVSGRNPFSAAADNDVYVDFVDGFHDLLGMYTHINGERHILLNSGLSEVTGRIVCAHELGHDILHRDMLEYGMAYCDNGMYGVKSRLEYEANVFAAHLLLDERDILDSLAEARDVMTLARGLNTETDLLLIKLSEMKRLGYKINVPMEIHPNFVADLGADSFGIGDGFSDGI